MSLPHSKDSVYSPENAYVPPVSTERVFKAAWDLGIEDRETSVLSKMHARSKLRKIGEKVSPEELNEQYEGLNADRAMTKMEAQFIYDEMKERHKKEAIINRASDSFMKGKVLPFIAGVGSAMMDPIGMALGAITGGAASTLTYKASLTGAKKFAISAADNMVGNAFAETLVWQDRKDTFQDYGAEDFLTNVVAGSIVMTGAVQGLSKLGSKAFNSVQGMNDTLMHTGKDPKLLDAHIKKFEEVHTHTDLSKGIVTDSFQDRVEIGDDWVDTMSNVKEAYAEGKIDDAEMQDFMSRINESEIDNRVMDTLKDEDTAFRMKDEELNDFKTKVNSPESDINYNKDAAELSDNLEGYDPEARQQEIAAEIDEEISALKTQEVGEDGEVIALDPEKKKVFEDLENDLKIIDVQNEYAKCRIG